MGKGGPFWSPPSQPHLPKACPPPDSASLLNCLTARLEPLEANAMKTDTGAIGVLGGVGPKYAGLDLMRKDF